MKQLIQTIFTLFSITAQLTPVAAQTPASVSGRAVGYVANRTGDYDGVRLLTPSGEVRLFFPPHTAAAILRLATVGQRVTADVAPRPGSGHDRRREEEGTERETTAFHLIRLRNETSGLTLQLSNLPPPLPKPGVPVQAEGALVSEMHDDRGQLSALVIDRYVIVLPPHQAAQISSLLIGVQRLGVAGFERTEEGFVNRTGHPVIHPTSLTIRGQTFTF